MKGIHNSWGVFYLSHLNHDSKGLKDHRVSFNICDTEKNEASCEQILFRRAVYYTQVALIAHVCVERVQHKVQSALITDVLLRKR